MKKIEVLDSTLRDGAQSEHISFSIKDKIDIALALDRAGIDIIEAGIPAANPKDAEAFKELKALNFSNAKLAAFTRTCVKGCSAENDPGLAATLAAGADIVAIVGKSDARQVEHVLCADKGENLRMIRESVKFFASRGVRVIFDAEHYFDGYKFDPEYSLSVVREAFAAGADTVALCDTNGGTFPSDIRDITRETLAKCGGKLGIHCHNDIGCAVAGSMASVEAGAMQVHGTFVGFGERCGNACLTTLIPNLQLKGGYSLVPPECLKRFVAEARLISETANISLNRELPYVGASAFAHKAGMHADAILKFDGAYEHIDPSLVGNTRRLLISENSGRNAVITRLKRFMPSADKNTPEVADITAVLKENENRGYQYEAAEGSLELIIRRAINKTREFFTLTDLKLIDQLPRRTGKSAAVLIKVKVGDVEELACAEGDGPVHAMDKALRRALRAFYPSISRLHLIDYKVRVLTPEENTAAKVRVLITSTDGRREWSTVGVSTDVIEASWLALRDSIELKLSRDSDAEK
jgi:2-isopropylmalate synthase